VAVRRRWLPDEFGHQVGDRPDLVHPADDLPGRHRHHVRLPGPHQALVRLADQQVLQR
jgi:hypothetical protein